MVAHIIITQIQPADGREGDSCPVFKPDIIRLLIPADSLRRQPQAYHFIHPPPNLRKIFVLAPDYQAVPMIFMQLSAPQLPPYQTI